MASEPVIDDDWRELNAIQRDILVALAIGGDGSGIDITERIGRDYSARTSTYRNLADLRERGLTAFDESGGDDRMQVHELTDAGWDVVTAGVVAPAKRLGVEQVNAE